VGRVLRLLAGMPVPEYLALPKRKAPTAAGQLCGSTPPLGLAWWEQEIAWRARQRDDRRKQPQETLTGRMMAVRWIQVTVGLLVAMALAGCGGGVTPNNQSGIQGNTRAVVGDDGTRPYHGSALGDDSALFSFGKGSGDSGGGGTGLGVNAFLWRGALETLSFMPLSSADPFGGVIITDWYTPPTSGNERFKATAYILGKQLRADGIRVQVFHEVLQGGQWVEVAVSSTTTADIENKVLERARELRTQTAGS
jgi:hypothetical protein